MNSLREYILKILPAMVVLLLLPVMVNANEDGFRIIGRITSQNALEPMDFQVSVFGSIDQIPHQPVVSITTDHNGIFSYTATSGNSFILEIAGEQGSGRVFVDADMVDDTIRVNYPVQETVVFLHTNDHHFDINLWDEFTLAVKEVRNNYQDVFLLEAGDVVVRHPHRWEVNGKSVHDPYWYNNRASKMIELRNELNYDVMTPGNHEFAYIENYTLTALQMAQFPLIAANIEISTPQLPQFDDYVNLQTKTGRSIKILGLSNDNAGREGVKQNDIFTTASSYMHLADSADIFMALTHIGLNRDKELAARFPRLDLIIGGHSHDLLEEAILVNQVLVAHAGGNPHVVSDEHPVYLGKVTVVLKNGVVVSKNGIVKRIVAE